MAEKRLGDRVTELRRVTVVSYKLLKLVYQIDKKLFLGQFITSIFPAVIPFLNVYIYKLIIDFVAQAASGKSVHLEFLYLLIGFRFITFLAQDIANRLQDHSTRLLWVKAPMYMQNLTYSKIATLDYQYFEDSTFQDLIEKVDDCRHRYQLLVGNIFFGFQSILSVIIAIVALARLNVFLIFLLILITVPGFVIQLLESKVTWALWDWQSPVRKRFWYVRRLFQHGSTMKEIKLFGLEHKFLTDMRRIEDQFIRETNNAAQKYLQFGIGSNVFETAVLIGIEIFVITSAIMRKITLGDISFYTGVVNNFQNGIAGLFRNLTTVFENALYIENVFTLLNLENRLPVSTHPIKIKKKLPEVIFDDVSFTYPFSERETLSHVSFTIRPGEKIAFVGENGSGKTTIIKLLMRFYDVTSGKILIDGIDIKDLAYADWYERVGVLFQDFNKYEYTVGDNIFFGSISKEKQKRKIRHAAVQGGADSVIENLPKGYQQLLGKTFEEGVELSQGQWQKLALSRAFYRDAPILILDEPTSAIDAKAEYEIFQRVQKLEVDKTVIIISHRFSTVRNADRILVMSEGQIVEEGNHAELMKQKGLYAELFTLQAKGYQ